MSRKHKLSVQAADPLAEITVYDGAFKRIGRGVGRYEGKHPDGLYEVRARLGGAIHEKLVSLDQDQSIAFEPVAFASPIPLEQTTTGDNSHEIAVAQALTQPKILGAGSGLLVVVRDRPGGEGSMPPPPFSPAAGLRLVGPGGEAAFDVGGGAIAGPPGGFAVAAVYLQVKPGDYRLRLDLPGGGARERTLVASPHWRTQCFMVRRSIREHPRPDIDQGAVSISRLGSPFAPDDEQLRLAEAARDALVSHRQVADAAARALMRSKFDDPMLGLLVAHLLLRDKPHEPVLDEVITNLIRLLGANHPDVHAIALGSRHEDGQSPITQMPMLRASWDRIVQHSLTHPHLVPPQSPAALAATRVLPSAPWLVWEPPDAPSRRGDSKMSALRGYLRESAEQSPPAGASSALESVVAPGLDYEDREELARSLAVPASVLDDMLAKLGR